MIKQGMILFSILLGCCLLAVWAEQYHYDSITKEREQIESAMQRAIEYAADCAVKEYSVSEDTINVFVNQAFFESLYAALGYLDDLERIQQIELCVPVVAVLLNEGMYFNYLEEESTKGGGLSLIRVCSNQYPYMYENDMFSCRFFLDNRLHITNKAEEWSVYTSYEEMSAGVGIWEEISSSVLFSSMEEYFLKKKEAIASVLVAAFKDIISVHNRIAGQYGAAYIYTIPDFLQKYQIATENISVLAVVQGWPIAKSKMEFYEGCIESGAYIRRKELYCLEKPNSLEQPYAVFHKNSCQYIGNFGEEKGQVGLEEAVEEHGAFGCPYCILETEAVLIPRIK